MKIQKQKTKKQGVAQPSLWGWPRATISGQGWCTAIPSGLGWLEGHPQAIRGDCAPPSTTGEAAATTRGGWG
jgi:hypothetical protein